MKKNIYNRYFNNSSLNKKVLIIVVLFSAFINRTNAQYYKTNGTQILDGSGKPVFISGMNLGNWLVWEGYLMMGDYNYRTHSQFFNSMKSAFGGNHSQAMDFQHQWRMNYVTEQTIIDLRNRGFNSVRVPFHYNMFWNGSAVTNDGFYYFDRLIGWCRTHGMTVLLDMHAAPGYQNPGDHCDNNESNASQPRTSVKFWDGSNVSIASQVWRHIAAKYVNEPVIWGYDLINEPVPQDGREYELLNSLIAIKNAIRQVDNNHIIVAEGSWWGSDMQKLDWTDATVQSKTGVTTKWDYNLVYQTHHYSDDLSQLIGRRNLTNKLNIPLMLGEYGETSETKILEYTNWCKTNGVHYFPWSFKKLFHDKCIWTIPGNDAYNRVRNYINYGGTPPANAYNDMIAFCNNNIANGKAGQTYHTAFFDAVKPSIILQAEHYSSMAGMFVESTTDEGGGKNIAGTNAGEWLAFNSIRFPVSGSYLIEYRVATAIGGRISSDLNAGAIQLGALDITSTGGWQNWRTVSHIVNINAGTYNFGIAYKSGEVNLNWVRITKTGSGLRLAAPETEIEIVKDGSITVYPNPVANKLYYTLPKGNKVHHIQIRDFQGQVVSKALISEMGEESSIDLSNLEKGIYLITISDKGISKTFKIEKE